MSRPRAFRRSLHRLEPLRRAVQSLRLFWLRAFWRIDIDRSCQLSRSARLDLTHPTGIHVGPRTYLAFDVRILSHDRVRGLYLDTRIGADCFIGGRALILPGVEIGDGCVVGAGSVVTRSAPAGSVLAGNPARIIRRGIETVAYGRLAGADAATLALVRTGALR